MKKQEVTDRLMVQLEQAVRCTSVFLGEWLNIKKRIELVFTSEDYQYINHDAIEELIVSYTGGEKLRANATKDSNYRSSGHVWESDIYDNLVVVFHWYLKTTQKKAEYFLTFLESLPSRFESFNKDTGRWSGVGWEQNQFICNMYMALLENGEMTFSQKYTILDYVKSMVIKHSFKYYRYNKKLLDEFCKLFPGIITLDEREKIKDKLLFKINCIDEKTELLLQILNESKVELIKKRIEENRIIKSLV